MVDRNADGTRSSAWLRLGAPLAGVVLVTAPVPLPMAAPLLLRPVVGAGSLLAAEQEPAASLGQSADELKAAIAEIKRRLAEQRQAAAAERPAADLAEELKAARLQIERLTQTMAELRGERDALRSQLADARGEQQALEGRLAAAQKELLEKEEGLKKAETELDRVRAESARLAGRLAQEKQAADALLGQREATLKSELDATKAKLVALAREADDLRSVAAASVEEVKSLGEQLITALGENKALTAAVRELHASKDLLDKELQTAHAGAQADGARTEPARGEAMAAPATAAAPLTKLEASDVPAATLEPAAGPVMTEAAMTRLDGSAFVSGGAEIRPEAAPMLQAVATFLSAHRGRAIRIVGHTDSNGDREANRILSLRRAEKVRDYLAAELGFDATRIRVEGAGEDQPVASNDTAAGRRANRRVEIYVVP